MRECAQEAKAAARRRPGRGQSGRGKRRARENRRDAGTGSLYGRAASAIIKASANPLAENLVWDARV
jgi:hypothetical protein